MTEAEWLNCVTPGLILTFLVPTGSETQREDIRRRYCLFACACVRGIWPLLRQTESANAVEVAERFADGLASEQEIADARVKAAAATRREVPEMTKSAFYDSATAAEHVTAERFRGKSPALDRAAYSAATAWAQARWQKGSGLFHAKVNEQQVVQANLLRDVFGNPFRPREIDAFCLTPTVRVLAQAAYDERLLPSGELAPDRLAVLSDALEEVGCTDRAILDHLRGPGPHIRGCWCVDLCLAKK